MKSPTSASPHFAADLTRKPHELGESEVFEVFSGQDELSGDTCDSPMRLDALAGLCAVPDTACRRTLIGEYTLRELEKHLLSKGYKTIRRSDNCTFGFGNAGILHSKEAVLIPAQIGHSRLLIRAYVLPKSGKWAPLLLSKEFLKSVGAVLDMDGDIMGFKRFGFDTVLKETRKGHYAIPMFEFPCECHVAESVSQQKKEKTYVIAELEKVERESRSKDCFPREPAQQSSHAELFRLDVRGGHDSPDDATDERTGQSQGDQWTRSGSGKRHGQGRSQESSLRRADPPRGQVHACQGLQDHGLDVCSRQGLRPMGQSSHQQQEFAGNAEVPHLHFPQGHQQKEEVGRMHAADARHEPEASASQRPQEHEDASPRRDRLGHEHGMVDTEPECMGSDVRDRGQRAQCDELATLDPGTHGPAQDQRGRTRLQVPEPSEPSQDGVNHDEDHLPVSDFTSSKEIYENISNEQDSVEASADEKEESEPCVMSRKHRRQLEKNIHDINVVGAQEILDDKQHDVLFVNVEHVGQSHYQDFQEIFSVPRVAPVATRKGLNCGESLDLRNGWNFLDVDHRRQCRDMVIKKKPRVLGVSPPCGPFSSLQRISQGKGDIHEKKRKYYEGCVLLQFAMELCELQMSLKGIFIFEHPRYADSWNQECVQKIQSLPGVNAIDLDQCCFGLKDPWSQKHYKKPTRLLTNSEHAAFLGQRCKGDHQHQHIEGQTRIGDRWVNRSLCAQVYPKKLVEALVKLIVMEVKQVQQDVFAAETLKFEQPHVDLESAVMRCHVNLGHPSKERFLHMLKSANASEKTIECAKKLNCSTCSSKRLQESHAVAKHKRAESFNQQLNMDVFDLPIFQNKVLKMLNILDEGTSMQLCLPLWKGARASEVRRQYRKYWKRWAGVPQKVLTDGGTEFDNETQEGFDNDGTYVEKTAAFAPWQNGACERYGGIWKKAFSKAFEECQPRNKHEVNELIDQVNVARNSLSRRHGFSPYQHVFGNDLRLPGLLTEGESMSHAFEGRGAVHQGDGFQERHNMRVAARKSYGSTG